MDLRTQLPSSGTCGWCDGWCVADDDTETTGVDVLVVSPPISDNATNSCLARSSDMFGSNSFFTKFLKDALYQRFLIWALDRVFWKECSPIVVHLFCFLYSACCWVVHNNIWSSTRLNGCCWIIGFIWLIHCSRIYFPLLPNNNWCARSDHRTKHVLGGTSDACFSIACQMIWSSSNIQGLLIPLLRWYL